MAIQETPRETVGEGVIEDLQTEETIDDLAELTDAVNYLFYDYSTAHLTDPVQIAERDETRESWDETLGPFEEERLYYFSKDPEDPTKKFERSLITHGIMGWTAGRLQDPNLPDELRRNYEKYLRILEKYSKPVIDIDRKRAKTEPERNSRFRARVTWELDLRKKHGLTNGNEVADAASAATKVEVTKSELVAPRPKRGPRENNSSQETSSVTSPTNGGISWDDPRLRESPSENPPTSLWGETELNGDRSTNGTVDGQLTLEDIGREPVVPEPQTPSRRRVPYRRFRDRPPLPREESGESYDKGTIATGSEEPTGPNPFDEIQTSPPSPTPADRAQEEFNQETQRRWEEAERLRAVREQLQQQLIGAHSHIWDLHRPFDTEIPHTPTPIPDKAISLDKFEAWPRKEEETAPHPIYFGIIADRTSDLKKRAREVAREYVRAQMADGNILNNAWKKIVWRQVEPLMVDKFALEAEKYLLEVGDIYATIDWEKRKATSTPESQTLVHDSGLAKINLLRSRAENSGEALSVIPYDLKQQIINHIAGVIKGEESDRSFQEALLDLIKQYGINPPSYLVTDLLELTHKMKADIAEGKIAPELALGSIKIAYAVPEWGSEEKERLSVSSKAVKKIQKTRLGYGVNPAGIGIASSLGIFAAKGTIGWGTKTATALPLIGAIPGGAYAFFRSKAEDETDLPMHRRDKVYGGKLPPRPKPFRFWEIGRRLREGGLARRWELEDLRPSTVSVDNLLGQNHDLSHEEGRNELLDSIAEIRARLEFPKAYGFDLITYSSRYTIEQERLQLEAYLRQRIAALEKAGMQRVEIENQIEFIKSQWNYRFLHNVESQQIEFERRKLRKAVKTGVVGAAAGAIAGAGAHDILVGLARVFGHDAGSMFIDSIPPFVQSASAASPKSNLMPDAPDGTYWRTNGDNFDLVSSVDPNKVYLEDAYVGKDQMLHFDQGGAPQVSQEITTSADNLMGRNGVWKNLAQKYKRDWVDWGSTGVYDRAENDIRTFKNGGRLIVTLPKQADGILLTLGDSKESIYIEAHNGKVVFDPHAKGFVTGSNEIVVSRGHLYDSFVNQKAIDKFPDGEFSSERGHRNVFSLLVDGQNGRIEAVKKVGAKAVKVFATIQGSAPVPHQIITNHLEVAINIPESIPTSTPNPTRTPLPTSTPFEPTISPTPSETPSPAPMPTPSLTPEPTPIATLESSPTPTPSASAETSPTPTPSLSPEPIQPPSETDRIGETYIMPAVAVPFYPRTMPAEVRPNPSTPVLKSSAIPRFASSPKPRPSVIFSAEAIARREGTILSDQSATPARQANGTVPAIQVIPFLHPELVFEDKQKNKYKVERIEKEGGEEFYIIRRIGGNGEVMRVSRADFETKYRHEQPLIPTPAPVQEPIRVVQQSRIKSFFSKIKNFLLRKH